MQFSVHGLRVRFLHEEHEMFPTVLNSKTCPNISKNVIQANQCDFLLVYYYFFLIPYSASVYKVLASVAEVLLGIDVEICMIIIAVVAALLLVFGGYLVQARADFMQGIVMMFGIALLIVCVIRCVAGGGYFIGSLCYRYFTFSQLNNPTDPDFIAQDYIVPYMLKDSNLPSVILGIVLVLLIAASVSTLCSVTLTASSTLTIDFIKHFKKRFEQRKIIIDY